jgi:RimJ/RimL family protein N-acetyltransferase
MVELELFDQSHLAAFAALLDDPDVVRFTRLPVSPPPDYAETWFAAYEAGRRDGTREAFAIIYGDAREFVGIGVAPKIDPEARTLELGYIVAPAWRGRGIATQALGLLTNWGFEEAGALRSELYISLANEGSKIVAARCGYVREGILRSAYFKDGAREDTEVWSRLPSD